MLAVLDYFHAVRLKVLGFKVLGSGLWVQGLAPPLAKKSAGQIEKETLKKRITNIEQGIMNVEVRYSIDLY
jgi:hypothetical protein